MTERTKMSRPIAVKTFFSKDTTRPLSNTEFMEFWRACSEAERAEFGTAAGRELGVEVIDTV